MENFKRFFVLCFKSKFMYFIISIIGFLTMFLITNQIINPNNVRYNMDFELSEVNYDFTRYYDEDLIESSKDKVLSSKGEPLLDYLSASKIKDDIVITYNGEYYTVSSNRSMFDSKDARFTKFVSYLFTDLNLNYINNGLYITGEVNQYLMGLLGIAILGFLHTIYLLILFCINKNKEIIRIHDNETIFNTPFHKKYWILSSLELKKIKNMVIMAILLAFMMIAKAIPLPSGFGNLGISLGYLFFAIGGMTIGPIGALIMGFISDTLGFMLFPDGNFFFGYTLNAMLAGFTYGLCFYRTKVTFSKVLFARIIVNLFVNVLLGSIWYAMLMGMNIEGFKTYLLVTSLPKNLVYLLPQTIALFIVFKAVAKALSQSHFLDSRISENITLF